MDTWSEETKRDFIFHYQSSSFKGNSANNLEKASFKRQSIHQILQAAQSGTGNETTCHILKTKLQDYSAIVDNADGVNNFASGVIDLIQSFLKPLPGECFYKSAEGCLANKPSQTELDTFLKNKKQFSTFDNGIGMITTNAKLHATSTQIPGIQKEKSLNQLSSRALGPSTVMNSIGSRVFGSGKVSQPPQPKPQANSSFRTAGTELRLQNAKKNTHGQNNTNQNRECQVYGSAKRSLGGRTRSVNSKFVPPVKSNSQEDVDSQPNTCEEELEDERLRLIDPKLVELIRSEIMDQGPPVAWDDIAGLHFAKATIQEIVVLPMLRPDIFTGLRRPPKGILLFGPPGTGKTLIGKCIASQSKSTFFNISASSLTSKWVGEGEKMVRTLFTLARVHQPAVVFIDEIDSLLSQRSDSEHESSRRIKTEFLVQLDGAGTGEEDRILVIGATNRPQELDEAARRRLVKRLYIPLPDHQARCQIVQRLMTTERNVLTSEHIEEIASRTEGFSGADMKNVCQEACLGPIRSLTFSEMQHIAPEQVRPVTVEDFTSALTRVRSSVSPGDLDAYITWDNTYGSGGAPK